MLIGIAISWSLFLGIVSSDALTFRTPLANPLKIYSIDVYFTEYWSTLIMPLFFSKKPKIEPKETFESILNL